MPPLDTDHLAADLHLEGDLVYLASTWGGLYIIDVSDPTAPLRMSVTTYSDNVHEVTASGTTCHIAVENTGLVILDASDPANPTEIMKRGLPATANGVHLEDSLLLVGMNLQFAVGPPHCDETTAVHQTEDASSTRLELSVSPNPSVGSAMIALGVLGPEMTQLRIVDASGRMIRVLRSPVRESSGVVWDGLDDRGRTVPGGVYFALARVGEAEAVGRVVVVR